MYTPKKILFTTIIWIVAQALFWTQVNAMPQVSILTHSSFLDSSMYYHVIGEVKNTGTVASSFVQVVATFYNSTHEIVGASHNYTMLKTLLPGRKSPFEILFVYPVQAAKIHHYTLTLQFDVHVEQLLEGLEIPSNSSYVDALGHMHVVGEIKNFGANTATSIQVVCAYYDEEGTVIAAALTPPNPAELETGETASFEIVLVYPERVALVSGYTLTAESEQYAFIPEFQWPLSALILIGATSIAIIKMKTLQK